MRIKPYSRPYSRMAVYRPPARRVLDALRVRNVIAQRGRNWKVEFENGMGVNVFEASDSRGETYIGRFYARRPFDNVRFYDEARSTAPGAERQAYQYKALTTVVPLQSNFHIDESGDVFADVDRALYPSGDYASHPRPRLRSVARDPKRHKPSTQTLPPREKPKSWTHNGFKYWSLRTADAEIVASMPENYTPHSPPTHAKYEVYSVKKGLPRFLGYLQGEQLARARRSFHQAFAR